MSVRLREAEENMKRPGLITIADIEAVLKREETTAQYVKTRDALFAAEPTLAGNVKHWVKYELDELKKKHQNLPKDCLELIAHLLERYLIRGWMLQRKAYGAELEGWINPPEGG